MILTALALVAAQSQMQLDQLADADFKRADASMNAQYHVTMASRKELDADPVPNIVGPSYAAALLAAQRAWLAYRDAECLSEGFRYRGGSKEPEEATVCQAMLTRARTKQLHDLTVTP